MIPQTDQRVDQLLQNKIHFLNLKNPQSSFLNTANFNSRKTANSKNSRVSANNHVSAESCRSKRIRHVSIDSKLDDAYISKIRENEWVKGADVPAKPKRLVSALRSSIQRCQSPINIV